MRRFRFLCFIFGACFFTFTAASAWSASMPAARVEKVDGVADAVFGDQAPRRLAVGSEIGSGERIQVGPKSNIALRFRDESRFDIGPNGVFVVDSFEIGKTPEESAFAARILKGVFRFFTGSIAKSRPTSMKVGITIGTIGIRGTHVVGEVEETSAKIILMEPEDDPKRSTAIEVSNQFGSVVIDQPGFGTEIPDQFSPPSPVRRMQLRQVEDLLRAVRSGMRIQAPRPR